MSLLIIMRAQSAAQVNYLLTSITSYNSSFRKGEWSGSKIFCTLVFRQYSTSLCIYPLGSENDKDGTFYYLNGYNSSFRKGEWSGSRIFCILVFRQCSTSHIYQLGFQNDLSLHFLLPSLVIIPSFRKRRMQWKQDKLALFITFDGYKVLALFIIPWMVAMHQWKNL